MRCFEMKKEFEISEEEYEKSLIERMACKPLVYF